MTYFITRHQGAIAWAQQQQLTIDRVVSHLLMPYEEETENNQVSLNTLQKGDTIIGTLPIQIAAQVCLQGANYYHLMLDIPVHLRGKNLSASQMNECNARIKPYNIKEIINGE